MRTCEACGGVDAPALDFEVPCNPRKRCPPGADERPETHNDDCPKVSHEVRNLYRPAKLVHTPKHPEGELERKWQTAGWKVLRDGRDVFRVKMLCRPCIQAVYQAEERERDYVKACKAAQGQDDQTYSELLTKQSFL